MAKRTATVSTVCPPGCAAGDTLQIEHDSTAYDVPVPEGVVAGQSFQVQLPAMAVVRGSTSGGGGSGGGGGGGGKEATG